MAKQTLMQNTPDFIAQKWQGYFHYTDATMLPFNCLTFPSKNCSIPNNDKIIPDKGKTLYGQAYTQNTGIIGHKEKFKNMGGIEMEVRAWQSGDPLLLDVIEIGYQTDFIVGTNFSGVFINGEFIAGQTSGATAKLRVLDNTILFLTEIVGNFDIGETITGQTSGSTADTVIVPVTEFRAITESSNFLPVAPHEYYFDEWFDTNLDPSLSKNLPRLIWVNGYQDPTTKRAQIYSWSGGIATIVSIAGNTITTENNVTWRSLGFTENALGNCTVVINGQGYPLTNPSVDLDTDTITLVTTVGISVGDIATIRIELDQPDVFFPLDVCRANNGYMFYGGWTSRDLLMSNAFNRPANSTITTAQAVLNDLIVTGTYTGTTDEQIRIQISSIVQPPQEFAYVPAGSPNNLRFSGVHTTPTRDIYRVVISNATVGAEQYDTYKNDVLLTSNNPVVYDQVINLADGITITFIWVDTTLTPYIVNQAWGYAVGGVDTYSVYIDNVLQPGSPFNATAPYVYQGVTFTLENFQGHAQGDFWIVNLEREVDRAFANFFYNLPVRKPGEGYKFRLPSNFWTMDTQEDSMYVNSSYGEWSIISTQLSADLQSESVSLTPLKQTGAQKVLYPYLTGHIENDLCFIAIDKGLNTIGRKQFLEKPQVGLLSDPVKFDFEASSFVGGRIKYFDEKLYISSPENGVMHCFDNFRGYWQPPKFFPEIGILSIISNNLVCHSNTRNQTFTLFTSRNGDNGLPYEVKMRTPYYDVEKRWQIKNSQRVFTEGYIDGNPTIMHKVYLDIHGCKGIFEHRLEPVVCIPTSRAPFGQGSFGEHSFGSDVPQTGSYFQEIYKDYDPILSYYMISLELYCSALSHSYEILSVGMDAMDSMDGNNALLNQQNSIISQV